MTGASDGAEEKHRVQFGKKDTIREPFTMTCPTEVIFFIMHTQNSNVAYFTGSGIQCRQYLNTSIKAKKHSDDMRVSNRVKQYKDSHALIRA